MRSAPCHWTKAHARRNDCASAKAGAAPGSKLLRRRVVARQAQRRRGLAHHEVVRLVPQLLRPLQAAGPEEREKVLHLRPSRLMARQPLLKEEARHVIVDVAEHSWPGCRQGGGAPQRGQRLGVHQPKTIAECYL